MRFLKILYRILHVCILLFKNDRAILVLQCFINGSYIIFYCCLISDQRVLKLRNNKFIFVEGIQLTSARGKFVIKAFVMYYKQTVILVR